MDKQRAQELNRIRWGDSLTCRIMDRQGVRLAECKWNGERIEGRGKDNLSALKAVFKKIDELGK